MRILRVFVALVIAANAGACGASASSDASQADAPFASAEALAEHINSLAVGGMIRMRDLAPLIHAETEFQQSLKQSFETIASAETIQDAVMDRFGAPIDADNGDIRIHLTLHVLGVVSDDNGRATAAVENSASDFKQLMLVRIDNRWWISGYTWEYSMSDARKEEMPRKTLVYQVEAAVAPDLVRRVTAGEFASIAQFRQAYRDTLMAYFEAHPDIYNRITGQSIPGR